jgi:succinate dehydrogenase / fumarate reductase flavoprotein subunit
MFDDIPPLYANQTADNEEEGWRYTQGDRDARRPPELLTRDHVARCIVREIKEGRGSPHGGVFLDISWITEKLSNPEAHIKKKLPAMYHQFKRLADIDITKQPMEVGPTTHYAMGGVRVDPDTQMSSVPGLFSAGECTAGLHGANRLGGNSLSDLLVFGKLAGECAARYAKEHQTGQVDPDKVDNAVRRALAPFDRADGEGAYDVQKDLQEMMQAQVGIVREEKEMVRAIESFEQLRERAERVAVHGNRAFNPGWHTAMDLRPLLTVGKAIARAALERKESRGAHFRNDYPDKSPTEAEVNIVIGKGSDGSMETRREPRPEMPSELKAIIEEMQ